MVACVGKLAFFRYCPPHIPYFSCRLSSRCLAFFFVSQFINMQNCVVIWMGLLGCCAIVLHSLNNVFFCLLRFYIGTLPICDVKPPLLLSHQQQQQQQFSSSSFFFFFFGLLVFFSVEEQIKHSQIHSQYFTEKQIYFLFSSMTLF